MPCPPGGLPAGLPTLLGGSQQRDPGPGGAGAIHGKAGLACQVGTGEGKSMIVAALAIYVVVALKKKVHVAPWSGFPSVWLPFRVRK